MRTTVSNLRKNIAISLLLTISIDIALISVEMFQNTVSLKSYVMQLCLNIYIMIGYILCDFNALKLSQKIEEITFRNFSTSIYKHWKYNCSYYEDSKNSISTIKYNYEKIILPYIRNALDLFQKLFDLLFCVLAIIILLANNIFFGVACISFLIFIFIVVYVMTMKQETYQNRVIEAMSILQNTVLDCYMGIRDILIYRKQGTFLSKLNEIIKKVTDAFYKSLLVSGLNFCIFNAIDIFVPTLLLLFLNKSPVVDSFNLICITFYFSFSLKKISTIISIVQSNIVLRKKVQSINVKTKLNYLFFCSEIEEKYIVPFEGSITETDSSFFIENYYSKISCFSINRLHVPFGTKQVLVAPVGTGKSVLFRDIFESIGSEKTLFIPAKIEIFTGSVLENIFFDKNHLITEDELSVIEKMGFSYNFLSHQINNNELSGGEKKRIGFLRFFFNMKDINILDEVLSEVEEDIIKNMVELIVNCEKTVILASHNEYVKTHLPVVHLLELRK